MKEHRGRVREKRDRMDEERIQRIRVERLGRIWTDFSYSL